MSEKKGKNENVRQLVPQEGAQQASAAQDQGKQPHMAVEPNSGLNINQAISILIQGVKVGQQRGAYTLEDAAMIAKAVLFFEGPKKQEAAPSAEQEEIAGQ